MDRPANDTTTEARVVQEVYLIDPATKKPGFPGGGGGGGGDATEATQLEVLAAVEGVQAALEAPVDELPPEPLMPDSDMTAGNVSRSGAGETSMVAATTAQTTKLYCYAVTVPGAGTVEIRDGAGGAALRKHIFPATGGIIRDVRSRPYAKTTANTALMFYWSGSGEANIDFDYVKGA